MSPEALYFWLRNLMVIFLGCWISFGLWNKRRLGVALMCLGQSKWMNQVAIVVWVFAAIVLLIQVYTLLAKNGRWDWLELIWTLMMACFCLFIFRGFKLEIREGGICYNTNSWK
jgi:hypothetical protein